MIASAVLLAGEAWYLGYDYGFFEAGLLTPLFATSMAGATLAIASALVPSPKAAAAFGWTACALLCGSGLALLFGGGFLTFAFSIMSMLAASDQRDHLRAVGRLPLLGCGPLICGLILQRQLLRNRRAARSTSDSP